MATRDSYFREKQIKLDAQFDASRKTESNIFAGVVAAVDGFTGDLTALEIKQIMSRHGGTYAQYVFSPGITHIIASNLPTAKVRKELSVKRRTPLAIVTPQWIIDSLKAKRQLPWGDYTLAQLHSPDQTTLNSWRQVPSVVSSSSSAAAANASSSNVVVNTEISVDAKGGTRLQGMLSLTEDPILIEAKTRILTQNKQPIVVVDGQVIVALCENAQKLGLHLGATISLGHGDSFQLVQKQLKDGERIVASFMEAVRNRLSDRDDGDTLKVISGMEMLNSRQVLLSSNDEDEAAVWEAFERIRASVEKQISVSISLDVFKDPLSSWVHRAVGDVSRFSSLPCVPSRLASRYAEMTIADAGVALVECRGNKERTIRRVCLGSSWRRVPSVFVASDYETTTINQPTADEGKMKVLLTAQVTVSRLDATTAEMATVKLIQRIRDRPAATRVLSRSRLSLLDESSTTPLVPMSCSEPPSMTIGKDDVLGKGGLLLTVSAGSHRSSAVCNGDDDDLQGEALALVRGVLESAQKEQDETGITIRLDVSEASNVNPHSFSQISPQTLKHLPREIVRELRDVYSKGVVGAAGGDKEEQEMAAAWSTPMEERSKPIMPDSFSQVDVEALRELPMDIRREVEAAMRERKRAKDQSHSFADKLNDAEDSKPAIPRSFTQVDQSVLEELPSDIRISIQRELMSASDRRAKGGDDENDGGDVIQAKQSKKRRRAMQPTIEEEEEVIPHISPLDEDNSRSSWPETFSQVDQETLKELPPHVALEIEQAFKFRRKAELEKKRKEHLFTFATDRNQKPSHQNTRKIFPKSDDPMMIDLTSTPTDLEEVPSVSATKETGQKRRELRFQSFDSVRDTVIPWFSSLHACPHQDDSFERCCQSYIEALFSAGEVDKVVMLMSMLERLCSGKRCAPHEDSECWHFAFQDLKRHILRLYRQRFNSNLALNV